MAAREMKDGQSIREYIARRGLELRSVPHMPIRAVSNMMEAASVMSTRISPSAIYITSACSQPVLTCVRAANIAFRLKRTYL